MNLAARRLAAQQISQNDFEKPEDVVGWLAAVQAQDYAGTRWAVGVRLGRGSKDSQITRALADGTVLRTHAMRWTWQLVTPRDIRWILDLVAPAILRRHARRRDFLGVDAAVLRRSRAVLAKALRDGVHRTRAELAGAYREARIDTAERLSYLLGHAELEGLICSGIPRGKQTTHALLEERAPKAHRFAERDEALAELARRYFRSRGPATIADFIWWSSLPASEARRALEAVKAELSSRPIDGQTYFYADADAPSSRQAYLLPAFDEFLVAYRHRGAVLDPKHAKRQNAGGGMLHPCIVLGGKVIATWRRTLTRDEVHIDVDPFEPFTTRQESAIAQASRRYLEFVAR